MPSGDTRSVNLSPTGLATTQLAMAGLAIAVAASMGLPFVRVGLRSRSAYATVRSARTLELADGPLRTLVVVAIVAVPVAASGLLFMSAVPPSQWQARTVAVVATAVGIVGASVATIGLFASGLRLAGPPATLATSLFLLFITFRGLKGNSTADGEHQRRVGPEPRPLE